MEVQKYAWRAKVKPGMEAEYKKRHDEIWPEMLQMFKEAGVQNYSVWLSGDDLFGYYECTKGIDFAIEYQKKSPIVAKWDKYMSECMYHPFASKDYAEPRLDQMFDMK